MVYFRSTTTFLAIALSVAGPRFALGEDTPTFHVLTGTSDMACSPEQVAVLKMRFDEAATLAKAAFGALDVDGVETSPAFKEYLGNAHPKIMKVLHYAPLAKLALPVDIKSVTSDAGHKPGVQATAPDKETLLECYPPKGPPCTTQDGKTNELHARATSEEQTLRFCPVFFEKMPAYNPRTKTDVFLEPLSIDDGKAGSLRGGDVMPTGGLIILHEMQHLQSVVGVHTVRDLWIKKGVPSKVVPKPANPLEQQDAEGVYPRRNCIGLPQDQKRENAQNIAYFGLDVYADPARAQPVTSTSGDKKNLEAV